MKLIATVIATIALLFGGTVALAAPASADCAPFTECGPFEQPTPTPTCPAFTDCAPQSTPFASSPGDRERYLEGQIVAAEQTANEFRAQVVALTAQVERATAKAARLQRVADKRAATIQKLRAKIRSLR